MQYLLSFNNKSCERDTICMRNPCPRVAVVGYCCLGVGNSVGGAAGSASALQSAFCAFSVPLGHFLALPGRGGVYPGFPGHSEAVQVIAQPFLDSGWRSSGGSVFSIWKKC